MKYDFFRNINNSYNGLHIKLPKSFENTYHLYDLHDIILYLPKRIKISDTQKLIMLNRYENVDLNFVKENVNFKNRVNILKYKLLKLTI